MAAVQKRSLLEQEVVALRKKLSQAEAAQNKAADQYAVLSHKAAERDLAAAKQCETIKAQLSHLLGDLGRLAQVFVANQDLGQGAELYVALANCDQKLHDLACAHEHELNQLKALISSRDGHLYKMAKLQRQHLNMQDQHLGLGPDWIRDWLPCRSGSCKPASKIRRAGICRGSKPTGRASAESAGFACHCRTDNMGDRAAAAGTEG